MVSTELCMEVVNPNVRRGGCGVAMIDFDGTVSLLREGWDRVMIPMMVEVLQPLPGTHEDQVGLERTITDWVLKLNGQPTIQQMAALAREVERRGGRPQSPAAYKQQYLTRLMREVEQRRQRIRAGGPEAHRDWVVPGIHDLLSELHRRGIPMFLASGTDLAPLREEAQLLQVADYFSDGIHGPDGDDSRFSKAAALDHVLSRRGLDGCQLMNFGDGYVETQVTKERGGVAVGVAYDAERPGELNAWRREQLLAAGADVIVPDLRQSTLLLRWLMD
jgi:phosphoglycolate phosphatase-like HAD superfamily hydrolase